MSDNFRDLERPDPARRKDAVLMAAISALECLDRPTLQDLAGFSRLFFPLYATASPEIRRTASATLSRLPRVPDDVAEMLINQPISIAAPFIATYRLIRESALARAVARNGAPHARAAARRPDLSPEAITALRSLKDPSVEGLLVLRGLIPGPDVDARATPPAAPAPDQPRTVVDAPPLDPSEELRSELRALALRGRMQAAGDEPANPYRPVVRVGRPALQYPLNRPVITRKSQAGPATPAADLPEAAPVPKVGAQAGARHALAGTPLDRLARYARPDQETWFATALADALESSYALAERIMMDVSGRQLATALIGLGAPRPMIRSALEGFFPHLARPSARHTLASDLIAELDAEACAARLAAWQRADSYTTGGTAHVPALADGKSVRQTSPQRSRTEGRSGAGFSRKTG